MGITLCPDQVARWVLSCHVCNAVSLAMDGMFNDQLDEEYNLKSDRHKEEGMQRKKLDAADRNKIQTELSKYPHPLHQDDRETVQHSEWS